MKFFQNDLDKMTYDLISKSTPDEDRASTAAGLIATFTGGGVSRQRELKRLSSIAQ